MRAWYGVSGLDDAAQAWSAEGLEPVQYAVDRRGFERDHPASPPREAQRALRDDCISSPISEARWSETPMISAFASRGRRGRGDREPFLREPGKRRASLGSGLHGLFHRPGGTDQFEGGVEARPPAGGIADRLHGIAGPGIDRHGAEAALPTRAWPVEVRGNRGAFAPSARANCTAARRGRRRRRRTVRRCARAPCAAHAAPSPRSTS